MILYARFGSPPENFKRNSGHFGGQKYTGKSINYFIFWSDFDRVSLKNDQKWEIFAIFSILPYTDDFFGLILDFPQNNGFSRQKIRKYWKSKNGVKTALTPLFKELWAIFGFLKFKNQIYQCKFGGHIRNILENRGFRPKSRPKMKKIDMLFEHKVCSSR